MEAKQLSVSINISRTANVVGVSFEFATTEAADSLQRLINAQVREGVLNLSFDGTPVHFPMSRN